MKTKITTATTPIYNNKNSKEQGWQATESNLNGFQANTELGCNLKTLLRKDKRARVGKTYQGTLRCDLNTLDYETISCDPHFTFVERRPWSMKRHPHVYLGKCINVKRKDDGTLYPTFNHPRYTSCYTFRDFCLDACTELLKVSGLVEKK